MVPPLIASLKAEETLFTLLRQIQENLMLYTNEDVLHQILKLLRAPSCYKHPVLRPEW